ncbi:hypothetical protein FRB94_012895 [Tulasnella sp. JGI-2019a]|nr:hypothetical protein FRB93_001620 [Tulasnella sp. JGI-2019a]KAG9008798.1 hypothetical protein FRB94_012895 [Tulasnella sp. JGI-2019a]
MTLGVMNLVTTQNRPKAGLAAADMPQAGKTVEEALTMLQSLRPEVLKLLDGAGAMDIPLSGLAVMKGNKEATFAAYTGPGSTVDDSAMWKACQLIQDRFRTAGFVTENRPLQLHCTLINSTFRQPRRPFSFMSVLEAVRRNPTSAGVPPPATMTPITLSEAEKLANFGTWPVDEIHICRLGSWDQEGRYVSIGHISLRE